MLGVEALSSEDRGTVHRARRLQRYLSQPFHVISETSSIKGVSVPLSDTLDDCEAFLNGEYDEYSEQDCYMRGSMKESI